MDSSAVVFYFLLVTEPTITNWTQWPRAFRSHAFWFRSCYHFSDSGHRTGGSRYLILDPFKPCSYLGQSDFLLCLTIFLQLCYIWLLHRIFVNGHERSHILVH